MRMYVAAFAACISALLVPAMLVAQPGTYSNEQYGFTFNYPQTHSVKPAPYGFHTDVLDETGKLVLRIEVEDLSQYPRNEYPSVSDPLRDFGLKRALLRCTADGPDGSASCPSASSTRQFHNPQGVRFLEVRLNHVRENYGQEPRWAESVTGPVYLADISLRNKVNVLVIGGMPWERLTPRQVALAGEIVNSLRLGAAPSETAASGYPFLDKYYEPVLSMSDVIYDREFTLVLYNVRQDSEVSLLDIPRSIVEVKSGGKSRRLPMAGADAPQSLRYVVPNTDESLIGIPNPTGGNCWNCNGYHLLSLGEEDFLSYYGQASGFLDLDGDGLDEPVRYEDMWEGGLGLLSHADAPGVAVPLSLLAGKLVPSAALHGEYYESELARLDAKIAEYPKSPPRQDNSRLLSLILRKFLIYRLMDRTDEGWQAFEQDARHYGAGYFFLRTKGVTKRYRIEDLKRKVQQALR